MEIAIGFAKCSRLLAWPSGVRHISGRRYAAQLSKRDTIEAKSTISPCAFSAPAVVQAQQLWRSPRDDGCRYGQQTAPPAPSRAFQIRFWRPERWLFHDTTTSGR